MHSQTRSLSSLDARERDAWRRLSDRAVERNPYFDVDFLVATHRRLRPDVDPKVAMVVAGGELRAVLPYVERRSAKRVPMTVRSTAAPLGASVADLHIPLLDEACAPQSMRALLAELGTSRLGLPVVVDLAVHRLEGPVWEALQDATSPRDHRLKVRGENSRGALRLTGVAAGSAESGSAGSAGSAGAPWPVDRSILTHLTRSRRRSLGRSLTALESQHGPLTWRERTEDSGVIDEFVLIETAGWKGDPTRGGEGVETIAGGTAWFREMTDHLRSSGQLYVGALHAGERCVYISVDMRSGDQWFGMRDVYDETFAAHSPGTLGRLAEIGWLATQDPVTLDSCVNASVYPQTTTLYPDQIRVGRVLVAANTAASLGFRALALAQQARPGQGASESAENAHRRTAEVHGGDADAGVGVGDT